MSYNLRYYQADAVQGIWDYIRNNDQGNALAVLPTGAGKSLVLSQLAKDVIAWKGRVVMLSHVKELVSQVADHIRAVAPEIPIGIYSAGLKSKDLGYSVTVAGIQSAVNAAEDFGPVDVICIDEVHRVPPDGEGQYRTFLETAKKLNPNVRLIGLTATPFRTSTGMICGEGQLFEKICFSVGIRELIVKGFLSALKSKSTTEKVDLSNVHIRAGEFKLDELEDAMMGDEGLVARACMEIADRTRDRKSILVFCSGIAHAKMVARMLQDIEGEDAVRAVFGETPSEERAQAIAGFKAAQFKYLVNVDVLTTGFDAPNVDAVAVLRPTMSPGLWYQMCGRGFRLAAGKADCLILDYGQNLLRHGPVDRIIATEIGERESKLWKECPKCSEVVPNSCEVCTDCGHVFEKQEREVKPRGINHDGSASDKNILSDPEDVVSIQYLDHVKKNSPPGHPHVLRVIYSTGLSEASEWICLEHRGRSPYAWEKAVKWWMARSKEPVPLTVAGALNQIKQTGLLEPKQVVLGLADDGKHLNVERVIDLCDRRAEWAARDASIEEMGKW